MKTGAIGTEAPSLLLRNAFSRYYLRWYLLPRLLRLLDVPLREHGLALGPGVGWETLALAERFPGATLVGVEYDADQVTRALRNLAAYPAVAARVGFRQRFPPESLFTRDQLARELESAGFGVEAVPGRAFICRLSTRICTGPGVHAA